MRITILLLLTFMLLHHLPGQGQKEFVGSGLRDAVKKELLQKHGEAQRFRIERGVDQVAGLWQSEDGSGEEFAAFCRNTFVSEAKALDDLFRKMEFYSEIIGGFFSEMGLDKDQPVDLDWGEITPLDMSMAQFNPGAHLSDDLFKNKITFWQLLNFPIYSLKEKTDLGPKWDRKAWAYARMGGVYPSRVPAEINQRYAAVSAEVNRYVSEYNIFTGRLVDGSFKTFFPVDMKLISHWGLRDEIRARYADPQGLTKQRLIYRVMERIIRQEIPAVVVNSDRYQWDPFSNKVFLSGKEVKAEREPDRRYKTWLDVFQVTRLVDAHSPFYPTAIIRSFDVGREISESDVEAVFREVLAAPQARAVARLIQKRLGRKIEPFDLWYPGLKGNPAITEEELNRIVAGKYPTREAFEKDIPGILIKLGFSPDSAAFISPKIQVDPARGSGHCAGSGSRRFKVRLRTRIGSSGMDYKGFNIAIHELGHAVESVLDLYKIDYYSLAGVPNNAFTEALAFVFQDRDLELLGLSQKFPGAEEMKVLDTYWNAFEGMGVSLVEMKSWHWLYDHTDAAPAQFRDAVIAIARGIWNQYYAPVFGVRDQVLLAIYSHMLEYPLYLAHYSLGNLIQFQVEDYLHGKLLGHEMERMCAAGSILPQLWMKNAVGTEMSAKPLLQAVDRALKRIK